MGRSMGMQMPDRVPEPYYADTRNEVKKELSRAVEHTMRQFGNVKPDIMVVLFPTQCG